MTSLTNLLAPFKARAEASIEAEVTFNGDSLDQDYIRALEASTEDVPRLLAALEGVIALHKPHDALMYGSKNAHKVQVCDGCGQDDGNWNRWPCPTVAAVVAALGEGK